MADQVRILLDYIGDLRIECSRGHVEELQRFARRVEKQRVREDKLDTALRDYISLLGDELDKASGFMHVHGQHASYDAVQRGEELRQIIAEFTPPWNRKEEDVRARDVPSQAQHGGGDAL